MKRFGAIKPLERIISTASFRNFHILINSIGELSKFPENTIAVFNADEGEFRKGDVIVNEGGTWTRLVLMKQGIDPVTRLRVMRRGRKVVLRWTDPRDRFDIDGNLLSKFYRSIVVRKLGSAPENEFDGTQIYINYTRNQYNGQSGKPYLEDTLPEGDGMGRWFYRVFAVSTDGLVNRDCDYAEALELTWPDIHELIKSGHAERVFAPGDEVPFGDNKLVVVGFDTVNVRNKVETPHTVSFITKYPVTILPFDLAKGTYRLTTDTQAVASKTYYYIDEAGIFRPKTMSPGVSITPGVFYEAQTDARSSAGSNRWTHSDIRAWLNSASEADYSAIVQRFLEHVTTLPLPAPPAEALMKELGAEFVNLIVHQITQTVTSRIDGSTVGQSDDRFVLPSCTNLFNKKAGSQNEGEQFEGFASGAVPTGFIDSSDFSAVIESFRKDGIPMATRSVYSPSDPETPDTGTKILAVSTEGDGTKLIEVDANHDLAIRYMFSIG